MKLIKYCKGNEANFSRPMVVAIGIVFFMYLAGEATGEFLYRITH